MEIVKSKLADISEINRLNNKYFKEIRDFEQIIKGKNDYFYVGREDGKIIGFSGFHHYRWNDSAFVINIFIHPDFRRRGYGGLFIERVIQEARKIGVRTIMAEAPSLKPVLSLYLKVGFRICGFNDRYYSNSDQEIAIFLAKDLR